MRVIGDYDIVVDDPTEHIPYAMFCSTIDALKFKDVIKKKFPVGNWKVMKLSDWQKQFKGE